MSARTRTRGPAQRPDFDRLALSNDPLILQRRIFISFSVAALLESARAASLATLAAVGRIVAAAPSAR